MKDRLKDCYTTINQLHCYTTINQLHCYTTINQLHCYTTINQLHCYTTINQIHCYNHDQPTPTKKWCSKNYIYLNDRAATNFTDVVKKMPKNNQVRKCKYISRLGDGSTDAAITEEELTYLLLTIEQGKPGAKFLSIESIEYTTAKDLKDAIKIVFSRVRTIFQTDSM